MVTREEVLYAYRFLLGREPESEAAIEGKLGATDWMELRDHFTECVEFRAKFTLSLAPGILTEYLMSEPSRIDVDVCEDDFVSLVGHIQRSWETLGVEKPYWSVITSPSFLPDNIHDNLNSFYASGTQTWNIFERAAARAGKEPKSEWTALELGCGVGRVTEQLARRFRRVLAYDISRSHLDLARTHLGQLNINNVTLSVLEGLDSLLALEPFHFFYSVIVLQHNPPPLMCRMLRVIFEKLQIGGCAYFQIPVGSHRYQFCIDKYLDRVRSGDVGMEMHMLPQKQLFQLLDDCYMRILDFQTDSWTGPGFQSVSLLAEKVPPPVSAGKRLFGTG